MVYLRRLTLTVAVVVAVAGTGTAVAGIPVASAANSSEQQVAATETRTIRYGPWTLPAATGHTHDEMGTTGNRLAFNIEKPCANCMVTAIKPNLVYEDGRNANINTGPMLHHAVIGQFGEPDLVCRLGGLGPKRLFSSGNERTPVTLPAGYGMRIDSDDRWGMLYDLMNHAHQKKTVYISIEYTYVTGPAARQLTPVTPMWLDVVSCFNPTFDVPAGDTTRTSRWTSTVSGQIVYMKGHLHHGGRTITATNLTTGQRICEVTVVSGGSPEYIDEHGNTEISSAPPCIGAPIATVRRGDVLAVAARYVADHPHDDVMGIMTGLIAER
jgi:Stress up-regulated Nod 19